MYQKRKGDFDNLSYYPQVGGVFGSLWEVLGSSKTSFERASSSAIFNAPMSLSLPGDMEENMTTNRSECLDFSKTLMAKYEKKYQGQELLQPFNRKTTNL